MPKQAPGRKSLKELMQTGEGLAGFAWPEHYSDFDIAIRRDGTWTYQGDPIRRKKLCQLFATVLQRDADGVYWLVTPGERGRITVEDAPFTAVECVGTVDDQGRKTLSFRTNLDYWVTADADHPITVRENPETGEPAPYIEVRDSLPALILRPVFYDLVEQAQEMPGPDGVELMLESAGARFSLGRC